MKYGETLQQRSIPEWENYNVDYNDLKRLIKIRTTRGQGEALTIPGHHNEAKALQAFEDEFFAELVDQHQRVDLFVRSKAGEINRRLVHLDKQIGQLQQRYPSHRTGKASVRCLERFSKAEEAAEKTGEEIRSLARFVGAQRLAFIKLLKKYKRWTASSSLEARFRTKILDQPTAFSKRDFQPLLTQYTDVLAAIRAPFEHDGNNVTNQRRSTRSQPSLTNGTARKLHRVPEQQNAKPSQFITETAHSTAAEIQAACRDSSELGFDDALATLPYGRFGGKASYWIHPDNLVELHVLLLQYTRLRRTTCPDVTAPAADGSRRQPRKESTSGNGNSFVSGGEDYVGLIICDDLQEFARRRSSATISDTEESAGGALEKAAATVRYSSNDEALLAVKTLSSDPKEPKALENFQKTRTKRKTVRHLFCSGQPNSAEDRLFKEQGFGDSKTLKSIRGWFNAHQEIQPLVQLQCKRTRFVGLKNEDLGGVWATLDRDILMRKTPKGFFSSKEGDLASDYFEDPDSARFPFAVLEVRSEGGFGTDFLAALDETHLTERIRGFSMETHAVATLCKPQGLPPPYWLPALDQDLRKIPATVKTAASRRPNKQLSPSASVGQTSTSATSTGDRPRSSDFSVPTVESPSTSIPDISEPSLQPALKKKRRLRKDRPLRQQIATSQQTSYQKYWNEYDNGDETSDNEPFAIYIDPNKSTSFPGIPAIHKAMSSMASQAKASSKKVKSWLRSSDQPLERSKAPNEGDNPYFHDAVTPEDDSDLDDSPTDPLLYDSNTQRQYSTFDGHYRVDHAFRARESLLARCCVAFYVASFVLLIVAALLASAGRRKAIFKVDVGVITGVVFSLVFAIAGTGCMFKRRENVGIAQRVVVFVALAVVCVGSGVLLAGVVGG
ncbi:MAG: hypothetical protein Q9225_002872 [Loekoesia sp. 1 TL-2023]